MLNRIRETDATSLLAVSLGLATAAVVVAQILSLSAQQTKTEIALFSILQFILSIAFAWVVSRWSFRKEFAEGQKAFATAAYRRTREIEVATTRLISRTNSPRPTASPDLSHELDVILAISRGIQQAVRFSIADWADVIGDEIETIEEIEELATEEATLRQTPDPENPDPNASAKESSEMSSRLEAIEQHLGRLRHSLPPALRLLASKQANSDEERKLAACQRQFQNELRRTGHIRLRGFWDPISGFGRSIAEFAEGTVLRVEINDAGSRNGYFYGWRRIVNADWRYR